MFNITALLSSLIREVFYERTFCSSSCCFLLYLHGISRGGDAKGYLDQLIKSEIPSRRFSWLRCDQSFVLSKVFGLRPAKKSRRKSSRKNFGYWKTFFWQVSNFINRPGEWFFSVCDTGNYGKVNSSGIYDLLLTSPDALPLSYGRLPGV